MATTGTAGGGQAVTQALAVRGVDVVWGMGLASALERVLASDRPTVLHVREDNAQPMTAIGGAPA